MPPALLSYIPDGYTEAGYIRAEARVYGELRFTFRPMLAADKNTIADAANKAGAAKMDRIFAKAMSTRVTAWSLTDAKGAAVPINEETLLRLKPALFSRLYWIVSGTDASDEDPNWTEADKSQQAQTELDAALAGTSIGVQREEADEKN